MFIITCLLSSKGQKLIHHILNAPKLFLEFHKVWSLDPYYLKLLTCDDHILELCKIASQKFNILVAPYMSISTRSILINVFFKSQFSYCHLTWICCSRNNRKISRLHELCLQIVYQDNQSLFEELLEKDSSSSFSCHQSIQNKKWFIL